MASESALPERGPVRRELFRLLCWSALLAPVGIVLHELGHFVVGMILGYPVQLNVGSVSGGPALGSAPDMAVALQASAGPIVTLVLMAIAARGLGKQQGSHWAYALAITAPLRFIVGGTYLFWVAKAWVEGTAFQGTPNFDEYNAALAFGLAPVWVVTVQIFGLVAYWIWVMTRPRSGGRIICLVTVLVGAIIGIALWMALVGPAILALV